MSVLGNPHLAAAGIACDTPWSSGAGSSDRKKKMSILSKELLNLSASGRDTFPSLSFLFKTLDRTKADVRAQQSLSFPTTSCQRTKC